MRQEHDLGGSFALGPQRVHRTGYGAMQLAGDGVFWPPRDRDEALRVLRAAVDAGVDHVDTAQFYGAGTVNELIREALYPYPDGLAIVSKVAARRDASGAVLRFDEPYQLRQSIEENLATLGVSRLAAVNLRVMVPAQTPGTRFDAQLATLIKARDEGLQRSDDVLAECTERGIAFVPFCPLGWPAELRHQILAGPVVTALAARLRATPAQVALAWLLDLAPNILLIAGTRTRDHLAENLGAAGVDLDDAARAELRRYFPSV